MLERIKKFIDAQNLSSSAFANEIGVQRSSVSHVLSGRNKPSLDFVIKIKEHYPNVNLDWLLTGKGGMISSQKDEFESKVVKEKKGETKKEEPEQRSFEFQKKQTEEKSMVFEEELIVKDESPAQYGIPKRKNIKKVILLYSDNSFEEFNPPA